MLLIRVCFGGGFFYGKGTKKAGGMAGLLGGGIADVGDLFFGTAVFDPAFGKGHPIGGWEFSFGGGFMYLVHSSRRIDNGAFDPLAGWRRTDGVHLPLCTGAGGPEFLGADFLVGSWRRVAFMWLGRGPAGRRRGT